jgi:hypothetical protein
MQASFGRQMNQSIKSDKASPAQVKTDEIGSTVSFMLGITSVGMEETIQKDIYGMITKKQQHSLNGYVLCLSKIVSHEIGWSCLSGAFSRANTAIPSKYYMLFNKSKDQIRTRGFQVGK